MPKFATVKIELIGNPKLGFQRAGVFVVTFDQGGIAEERLEGHRDYEKANSVGSRGVHEWFFLASGQVYHVLSPTSWKRCDDYFCHVMNGKIVRFEDFEDMIEWLRDHSG